MHTHKREKTTAYARKDKCNAHADHTLCAEKQKRPCRHVNLQARCCNVRALVRHKTAREGASSTRTKERKHPASSAKTPRPPQPWTRFHALISHPTVTGFGVIAQNTLSSTTSTTSSRQPTTLRPKTFHPPTSSGPSTKGGPETNRALNPANQHPTHRRLPRACWPHLQRRIHGRLPILRVHPQDLPPRPARRQRKRELPVEPPRAAQRRVEAVRPVGRPDDNHLRFSARAEGGAEEGDPEGWGGAPPIEAACAPTGRSAGMGEKELRAQRTSETGEDVASRHAPGRLRVLYRLCREASRVHHRALSRADVLSSQNTGLARRTTAGHRA